MNSALPDAPEPGTLVRVRSRQYLVEDCTKKTAGTHSSLVRLSCLDDDAQGEILEVLWEQEIDAEIVSSSWHTLAEKGFDSPALFGAYFHATRWNCVTATDAKLFQAPYRAGIEVMAYQLEPLRMALSLPRVNLFIADDVGLGKTIEAGLILRELLMRQRVRKVVVIAPPSVTLQWRDELEHRFGLSFVIYDRDYVFRMRRERGFGVNPWTTHSRFILSHSLLRDEEYAGPLRAWLGSEYVDPGSMLILDEAHHAAPASSSQYAIDSHFTRTIRDLAPRFEHRLFLSATPHNGLSNSFSALMEILDPQRFVRGDPITPALRDEVMVRRLKSDLRKISGGFPERKVLRIELSGLPEDTPELELSRLLDEYWDKRDARLAALPPASRAAQGWVLISLQKRLLSCIDSFYRTLSRHIEGIDNKDLKKKAAAELSAEDWEARTKELDTSTSADDARADLDESEVAAEQETTLQAASSTVHGVAPLTGEERSLLMRMEAIAVKHKAQPDKRVLYLTKWLHDNLCDGISLVPGKLGSPDKPWKPKRLVIFTEYAHTKKYLEQQLIVAIAGTDRDKDRIRTFHGGMPEDLREEIKQAFNSDPDTNPLRILIATDAAREGVNLQNYCADLFHFDLPWNPSRLEQRNGRIDRKLQRESEVRCHYFVYPQREADRVLEVLMERTKTIQQELGNVPPVLEEAMTKAMSKGLGPQLRVATIEALKMKFLPNRRDVADRELESVRKREKELNEQNEALQKILGASSKALGFSAKQLHRALNSSLDLLGAEPLSCIDQVREVYKVPALDKRPGADSSWADTMDTLRPPRERGVRLWDWRRDSPVLPVIFRDPGQIDQSVVHLHLEHRLVKRLLNRFVTQGFITNDLSRACALYTDDTVHRVMLLGRVSLYGPNASRLHDEVIAVAAQWSAISARKPLSPYKDKTEKMCWELLVRTLEDPLFGEIPKEIQERMLKSAPSDIRELLPFLETKSKEVSKEAEAMLLARGEKEAGDMLKILNSQLKRIEARIEEVKPTAESNQQMVLDLKFSHEEMQQLLDNLKHWEQRKQQIQDKELDLEPRRIREAYKVSAQRLEPIGIVYLWAKSG